MSIYISASQWFIRYVGSCIPANCVSDKLALSSCSVMFLTGHLYHLATLLNTKVTKHSEIDVPRMNHKCKAFTTDFCDSFVNQATMVQTYEELVQTQSRGELKIELFNMHLFSIMTLRFYNLGCRIVCLDSFNLDLA